MSSVEEAIKLNDNKELTLFEEKYYGFLNYEQGTTMKLRTFRPEPPSRIDAIIVAPLFLLSEFDGGRKDLNRPPPQLGPYLNDSARLGPNIRGLKTVARLLTVGIDGTSKHWAPFRLVLEVWSMQNENRSLSLALSFGTT